MVKELRKKLKKSIPHKSIPKKRPIKKRPIKKRPVKKRNNRPSRPRKKSLSSGLKPKRIYLRRTIKVKGKRKQCPANKTINPITKRCVNEYQVIKRMKDYNRRVIMLNCSRIVGYKPRKQRPQR